MSLPFLEVLITIYLLASVPLATTIESRWLAENVGNEPENSIIHRFSFRGIEARRARTENFSFLVSLSLKKTEYRDISSFWSCTWLQTGFQNYFCGLVASTDVCIESSPNNAKLWNDTSWEAHCFWGTSRTIWGSSGYPYGGWLQWNRHGNLLEFQITFTLKRFTKVYLEKACGAHFTENSVSFRSVITI